MFFCVRQITYSSLVRAQKQSLCQVAGKSTKCLESFIKENQLILITFECIN